MIGLLLIPLLALAAPNWEQALNKQAPQSEQAIIVTPLEGPKAELHQFEKQNGKWREIAVLPAVVGINGFAPKGEKVEGDKKTPTGAFGVITAWGYGANPGTSMPYKTVDSEDKVIDDPNSPDYNRWIHGHTAAKSCENILRKDGLYEFGLFLDYNTNPAVKNKGSAVFMHVWRSPDKGTDACVAVARENMIKVLQWMNPKKSPKIILNPQ